MPSDQQSLSDSQVVTLSDKDFDAGSLQRKSYFSNEACNYVNE